MKNQESYAGALARPFVAINPRIHEIYLVGTQDSCAPNAQADQWHTPMPLQILSEQNLPAAIQIAQTLRKDHVNPPSRGIDACADIFSQRDQQFAVARGNNQERRTR
jgi:hypothetical protein